MARREKGMGTLFYDKNQKLWVARLELPPDPRTGKRRQKVVKGKRKEVAAKKLRALRKEYDRTGDMPTSAPTVATYMTAWLERRRRDLKPRTWDGYESKTRLYITPALGKIKLDRLTPRHIHRLHDFIIDDKGLSPTSALQTHNIFQKALTDAEREGLVSRNVASLVPAPGAAASNRGAFTAEEAVQILTANATNPYSARLALSLTTGMRKSEALGIQIEHVKIIRDETGLITGGLIEIAWGLHRLTWEHGCNGTCNYKRGGNCPQRQIEIPASQERIHYRGGLYLLRPKTRSSWRVAPLIQPLAVMIDRVIDGRATGMLWENVIPGLDPDLDDEMWRDALTRAGVQYRSQHSARHTTSTLMQSIGIDEQTRMSILGHSSAQTTQRYTHISSSVQVDAANRLGALLEKGFRELPSASG